MRAQKIISEKNYPIRQSLKSSILLSVYDVLPTSFMDDILRIYHYFLFV